MTFIQRLKSVFAGLIVIGCSVLLFWRPEDGYQIVVFILSISILIVAIKKLVFYFTMARYMVDGKIVLYLGIVLFDAGIFTYTLTDVPSEYIMMYLVLCHLFSGAIDVMKAFEAKKLKAHLWRIKFTEGMINIGIAVISIIFRNRKDVLVYIYSSGLLYFGIMKVINAFKKSAIIYIQ